MFFCRDQPGAPSWPELPVDVVGEVMSRLPTHDDRLRFIAVCHEWRASGRQHWRPRQPSVAYLLLPIGTFFWFPEFRAPRHLDDCVNYCSAACDDWLLFEGDGNGLLHLMSPFTGRSRWLPELSRIRVDDKPIEVVNEPAPRGKLPQWRDADKMAVWKLVVCPNGLIAAIIGREHFAKVALCSLESMTWTLNRHDRWRWYEDMAFSDGKLYALTNRDDLLAFDVGSDAITGEPAVSRVERVINGSDGGGDRGIVKMRYLVRSRRGALLMVQRLILLPNTTMLFTVFEADLQSSPRRWVEASGLGADEALFVGRLCSRAVPASDAVRLRGGQIFFPTDDWADMSFRTEHQGRPSHHAAVYDMRERNVSYLVPRQIWTDGWAPVTWLFPDAAEY